MSTGDFRELWSLRDLGDPSGFSELRVLGADVAKSTIATYTSKKRPNIDKRQEYVYRTKSMWGGANRQV